MIFHTVNRWLCLLVLLATAASVHSSVGAPPAEIQPDPVTPYHSHRSDLSVGDRGEIHLDVSTPDSQCGEQWRFHAAEIVIRANRFGDAQFVALPSAGCTDCPEIIVRWMHEPTGHIEFDVNVFREKHFNACEETDP